MRFLESILNKRVKTACWLAVLVYQPALATNTLFEPNAQIDCNETALHTTSDAVFIARYCQKCTEASQQTTNCSLEIVDGVCNYTAECLSGYGNIQNPITANPSCTAIQYHIRYKLNGGVNTNTAPENYTIASDTVTLPTPTRDGRTFVGWYDNETFRGEKITEIPAGSVGDKTYFAKWKDSNFVCESGKWLHFNNDTKACLMTEKPESKSFTIRQNGSTYYLNMTTKEVPVNEDTTTKIKIYYNGREYCLHDESVLSE